MVAAQSEQFGLRPRSICDRRRTGAKFEKGGGHLAESKGVVEWRHGDIAAVKDGER